MNDEADQELKLPALIGLMGLIKTFDLKVPLPAVRSTISSGTRKTNNISGIINEYYPKSYAPQGLFGNIKFAMRYEPVDLEVWQAVFEEIDKQWLEEQIRGEPTGIYARRVWYLYELLTGKTLDVSHPGKNEFYASRIIVSGNGYIGLDDRINGRGSFRARA